MKMTRRLFVYEKIFFLSCFLLFIHLLHADDGYRLWLRYDKIDDPVLLQQYQNAIQSILFQAESPTLSVAKQELINGLEGLLGKKINEGKDFSSYQLIIEKKWNPKPIKPGDIPPTIPQALGFHFDSKNLGSEGFEILSIKRIHDKDDSGPHNVIVISANSDAGILYGVFAFFKTTSNTSKHF